ncbi:MAG: hypothetical protein BWX76_00016 [Candidatus Cloacimonetes bacterium ADurb.Bin089]|jgi:hypothetical protein|nr:MAG: hypothetical protein BWX76_00016 [Candidatus Cloacimonetes bacterium ADurb.Bin089]
MQKQQEIYPLSDTVKAEARFRVKTKICLEVAISEQFQPNSANVKKIPSFTIVEFEDWFGLVASVQVLVLTHNFSVWKPVTERLERCGLRAEGLGRREQGFSAILVFQPSKLSQHNKPFYPRG